MDINISILQWKKKRLSKLTRIIKGVESRFEPRSVSLGTIPGGLHGEPMLGEGHRLAGMIS